VAAYTLIASSRSFSMVRPAVAFLYGSRRTFDAAQGALSITRLPAKIYKGRNILTEAGSLTVTRGNASLVKNRNFLCAPISRTLSRAPAFFFKGTHRKLFAHPYVARLYAPEAEVYLRLRYRMDTHPGQLFITWSPTTRAFGLNPVDYFLNRVPPPIDVPPPGSSGVGSVFGFRTADSKGHIQYDSSTVTWNQVAAFGAPGGVTTTRTLPPIVGRQVKIVQMFVNQPPADRRAQMHTATANNTNGVVTISGGSEMTNIIVLMR
jgi:hypothetical protein